MTIKFVICGLEHSGTTLLSDIFRQSPELDAGFEVGVLLGNTPQDFPGIQPFYSNVSNGWQINEEQLEAICNTDSFDKFYEGLKAKSDVLKPNVQHIFDKTPRYFQKIFECYGKIQVPFIATYKDPRSIVFSDFKRTGKGLTFETWYQDYKTPKLRYLKSIYVGSYLPWKSTANNVNAAKILCISLEEICLNARQSMDAIFSHVGMEFKIDYLLMKNLRYSHTRAPEISSRIPFEYLDAFSEDQRAQISEDFSELADWFYS
jgi:hypothetical protein